MANQPGKIRIGTSNVVVPGNKTSFPPAYHLKSRLHYYSIIFPTVEVNSSFYKTPLFSTYERWSLDVPEDFRFSLKLSRDITHAKELQGDLVHLEKFMRTAAGIGGKKGCLLIQFPGKITLDYFTKVEHILQELEALDPERQWKTAVEFRHPGWYTGETWELLDEYGAAMVLHDIPKARIWELRGKARFVYLRFHGPKGDYRDSYSPQFLQDKAAEIKEWLQEGRDVYAYFNNTIGSAFENALSLKAMLE
jgi:uncharacterized protein YecE (DUF72 family)